MDEVIMKELKNMIENKEENTIVTVWMGGEQNEE